MPKPRAPKYKPGDTIVLDGKTYTVGTIPEPPRTRSKTVLQLITWADANDKSVVSLPFFGDHDKAHNRTRSWRKVCSRLGYVLHYKIDTLDIPKKTGTLLVWATKLPGGPQPPHAYHPPSYRHPSTQK